MEWGTSLAGAVTQTATVRRQRSSRRLAVGTAAMIPHIDAPQAEAK